MMDAQGEEYALAVRAQAGDREALAELVERLRLPLFALAYAELQHYDDAHDAVANALLRICLHAGKLREPGRLRAWMQRIVRNECRRLWRRSDDAGDRSASLEEAPVDAGPSLLRLDIERALRRLPGDQARALRMFYLRDVSIEEIARRLERPEGTVKSWLRRGRQRLAAEMENYVPMAAEAMKSRTAALVHTHLDPSLVRKVREALRGAGFRVKVLVPGDMARLVAELPKYQAIVVDEWLHERSALELLLHVRNPPALADVPVCLLSANPTEFTAAAYFNIGVDLLLDKEKPETASWVRLLRRAVTIPEVLPVIPLRDAVCFPRMVFPLFAGREKTVNAIEAAEQDGRTLLIVAQREMGVDNPGPEDFYTVGTAARILQSARLPDGSVRLLVEGTARVRVLDYLQTEPFFQARVEVLSEEEGTGPEARALAREITARFGGPSMAIATRASQFLAHLESNEDAGQFADRLVPQSRLPVDRQQALLETLSPRERLEKLGALLAQAGPEQTPGAATK
jgi:RNA polymerase sigma factor (sigma-70 family)